VRSEIKKTVFHKPAKHIRMARTEGGSKVTEWQTLVSGLTTPRREEQKYVPGAPRSKPEDYRKVLPGTAEDVAKKLGVTYAGCLSTLKGMERRGIVKGTGKIEREGRTGRSKIIWEWVDKCQ
jgi:hypothetical protein